MKFFSVQLVKKTVAGMLILSLVVPAILLSYPQKSEAVVSTIGGCAGIYTKTAAAQAAAAAGTLTAVPVNSIVANQFLAASASSLSTLELKENCYDSIFWFIAKILISRMTQSIVNWINSGFQGQPTFVADLGGWLQTTADEEFGNFMATAFPETADALDILCSPFKIEIRASLQLKYNSYFNNSQQCSLSDIIQNVKGATGSVDAFVGGDFSQGGWGGWYSLTQNPSNNKYGAYLQAQEELDARIVSATGREIKLLEFGSGFHSIMGELQNGTKTVLTPGAAIESQLATVMGSKVRQLELADEFNEIMAALFGQFIDKIFSGGGNLRSASGGNLGSGGFSDYDDNEGGDLGGYEDDGNGNTLPIDEGDTTTPRLVSLEKIATQSSNFLTVTPAYNAIDGSTYGKVEEQQAVTKSEVQAWWQVDLRKSYNLTDVKVWPRLDTRAELSGSQFPVTHNFYVLVSDDPMIGTLSQILAQPGVRSFYIAGSAGVPEFVEVNGPGRYVRIQQAGTDARWLELAEVQVYGTEIAPFVGPLPTPTP